MACRAYGLRPIDGPFGDFTDPTATSPRRTAPPSSASRASGRSIPVQIELANQVFTPSDALVVKTRRIIAAMKDAAAQGRGAVSLDGRLIDAASIRMAETLLAKLDQIEARVPVSPRPAADGRTVALAG